MGSPVGLHMTLHELWVAAVRLCLPAHSEQTRSAKPLLARATELAILAASSASSDQVQPRPVASEQAPVKPSRTTRRRLVRPSARARRVAESRVRGAAQLQGLERHGKQENQHPVKSCQLSRDEPRWFPEPIEERLLPSAKASESANGAARSRREQHRDQLLIPVATELRNLWLSR